MNNIVRRVSLFVVGIPLLFSLIFFLPQYHYLGFNLIVIIFSSLGAVEIAALYRKAGHHANPYLVPFLGCLLPLTNYLSIVGVFEQSGEQLVLLVAIALVLSKEVFAYKDEKLPKILTRISTYLSILLYPGFFAAYVIYFSAFPHASLFILFFFILIFANDTFAYIFGMLFGRKSFKPFLVSPNKSLVGFLAGFSGSIVASIILYFFFPQLFRNSVLFAIPLGLIIGITAILGDLVESAMKRSANVKDSGTIMPGRGGILDSIDSLVFSAPFFYYYIQYVLIV